VGGGNVAIDGSGSVGPNVIVLPYLDCLSFLPIELIFFKGTIIDSKILLSWATASEANNDFFTVERTADGKGFEVLGFVNGSGNSDEVKLLYIFRY
jgi:hypothetical protein